MRPCEQGIAAWEWSTQLSVEAHQIGSTWKDQPLQSFGDLYQLSAATKVLVSTLLLVRLGRELWALSWRRGRPNRASSEITRGLRGDVQRLGTSNHRQIRPPRFCGGFAEVHAKAENPLTPDVVVQHNSNPQRLLHHHSQPLLAHALPLTLQGPRGTPPPFHAIIHRDLDSTWAILGLDGPS